ncbi:MAG: acetate kinase [Lachnospiraceae bacterium]|nr:acetate kinase [Lachnospiraceae bacterium]
MKILVVNCGSSSIKFQLIMMENNEVLASGQIERIGIDGILTYKAHGRKEVIEVDAGNHEIALQDIIDALLEPEKGVITDLSEINAVGHRIVHGGEKFSHSVLIDDSVLQGIKDVSDLAPLHNPANIIGINACMRLMPEVKQVAVFDTAFHQTMPPRAYLYAVPYDYYEKYQVRRYGFHGTSHSYVSKRVAELQGLDYENSKIIVCHIGNGASVSAVRNGKSVDTSMGMTPLEGLCMGTRSGDLDPAVLEYICKKEGKSVSEITDILNKQSGVLGISKLSSDYRDLLLAEKEGNVLAKYAIDIMIYRVRKYVGAYVMALGGVDVIALCGGVPENNSVLRAMMIKGFRALGCKIDHAANSETGVEKRITSDRSIVPVWVVPTNEELIIAKETLDIIKDM